MAETLPDFENMTVEKATLRVVKAGDGLSEALSIQPKAYHVGDIVWLAMKGEIIKVEHRAQNDSEGLVRMHTLEALGATEVAEGDVRQFLDAAAERSRKAKEDASSQTNLLDGTESADEEDPEAD